MSAKKIKIWELATGKQTEKGKLLLLVIAKSNCAELFGKQKIRGLYKWQRSDFITNRVNI